MSTPPLLAADVQEAVQVVRTHTDRQPEIALVLGSGLSGLADIAEDTTVIAAEELPGYPSSSVAGHHGRLIFGTLAGRAVVFVQGRVHRYEGLSPRTITFPIRLVHALGARRLLLTNAAGGINYGFRPGMLMFIEDHINLAFSNPLSGPNVDGGPRFPDMSAPYDPEWLARAEQIALELGIATRRGTYLWTLGPSYETPAEIRAFRRLGADAVGMSTVPETLQAVYLGMKVLGISTITNLGSGMGHAVLDHAEVLEVGRMVRADLQRLVHAIVAD